MALYTVEVAMRTLKTVHPEDLDIARSTLRNLRDLCVGGNNWYVRASDGIVTWSCVCT